jgi:methylated-DNA-[protein]-cysteine S-methyltransferase
MEDNLARLGAIRMRLGFATYQSPIGKIHVVAGEAGIRRVEILEEEWERFLEENPYIEEDMTLCGDAIHQLKEYFSGQRRTFDLPLSIEGTDFRKKVWNALQTIPYGEVRSYADVAEMIGSPKAVRAVGQANRANQLPIIIPCHRVIGKNGEMVGYAGSNTPIKQMLLEVEGYRVNND